MHVCLVQAVEGEGGEHGHAAKGIGRECACRNSTGDRPHAVLAQVTGHMLRAGAWELEGDGKLSQLSDSCEAGPAGESAAALAHSAWFNAIARLSADRMGSWQGNAHSQYSSAGASESTRGLPPARHCAAALETAQGDPGGGCHPPLPLSRPQGWSALGSTLETRTRAVRAGGGLGLAATGRPQRRRLFRQGAHHSG